MYHTYYVNLLSQALAEFGHVAADDLNLNIDVNADHFSKTIHVTKSDSLVMKLLDVSSLILKIYSISY